MDRCADRRGQPRPLDPKRNSGEFVAALWRTLRTLDKWYQSSRRPESDRLAHDAFVREHLSGDDEVDPPHDVGTE